MSNKKNMAFVAGLMAGILTSIIGTVTFLIAHELELSRLIFESRLIINFLFYFINTAIAIIFIIIGALRYRNAKNGKKLTK